jgi:NADH dehydrogenase/NADH:ubiquinone oxidoreductase subunit G
MFSPIPRMYALVATALLLSCIALTGAGLADPDGEVSSRKKDKLPAYSEEREAAALCFIRKQLPDLIPILERLKTTDSAKYRVQIRETFQVTEWLSDLEDEDSKRHDLELELWKTETKALLVVAKLAQQPQEEQAKLQEELQEYTKKLVELDMQSLRLRVEELEKELGETREELSHTETKREALSKERYDKLFEQAKRRGMMK